MDLKFFKEEKIDDVVIFVVEKQHQAVARIALAEKFNLNYDDIFQRYIDGEEELRHYIFKWGKTCLGPKTNSIIKKEVYRKYMDKNIQIKYAYLQFTINEACGDVKLIETVEDENMKNYYYAMHYMGDGKCVKAEKYLDKCVQYDIIKYLRAGLYLRMKKYEEALSIYTELISNNYNIEGCECNIKYVIGDYNISFSKKADILYGIKHFGKALELYKKDEEKNIDRIIECYIHEYEKNKFTTDALELAMLFKKKKNEEEAVKWFKLSMYI